MKKRIINGIIIFIVILGISTITAYATSTYLYNSEDVSYDHGTNSITSDNVQGAIDELYAHATDYTEIRSMIYPVGSIYISVTDDTVAKVQARFGGTWEVFGQGKTLVGFNSSETEFDTIEETGGSKTINLSHSHTVNSHNHALAGYGRALVGRSTAALTTMAYKTGGASSAGYKYDRRLSGGTGIAGVNETPSDTTALEGNTGPSSPGTDSKLSATQSILQPYITVYMYKRVS